MMSSGFQQFAPLAKAQGAALQPAMWFDGSDYVELSSNTGAVRAASFVATATIMSMVASSAYNYMISNGFTLGSSGWASRKYITGTSLMHGLIMNNSAIVATLQPKTVTRWGLYACAGFHAIAINGNIEGRTTGGAVTYTQTPLRIGRIGGYWVGVIRDFRLWNAGEMTEAQAQAIIAEPESVPAHIHIVGDGNTNSNWTDTGTEGIHNGTVYGTPEICYITSGGKVIKGGVIMNP